MALLGVVKRCSGVTWSGCPCGEDARRFKRCSGGGCGGGFGRQVALGVGGIAMSIHTSTLSQGASEVVAAASAPLTPNATVLLLTCPLRRYS